MKKYRLLKDSVGNISFYVGQEVPFNLVKTINEVGNRWLVYEDIATICMDYVTIDARYAKAINGILPHVGYSWSEDIGIEIWDRDQDPDYLNAKKPTLVRGVS